MASTDDDEICMILDHFRMQPAFVSASKNNLSSPKSRRHKTAQFNSVYYKDSNLILVYLLKSYGIRLEFLVSTIKKPHQISYIADNYSAAKDPRFQEYFSDLCSKISTNDDQSLFSTVSKLLAEFQKLDPPRMSANRSQHHLRLLAKRRTTWDMPMFLMRCAATSGKSSRLCTPFPQESIDHDRAPSFVLAYIRDNIISYLQDTKRSVHPTMDEQAVMEFLACLQWTEHASITINDGKDGHDDKNKSSADTTATSKAVKVTINLNRDTTPHFNDMIKGRGLVKAFHGTSIESAWSILNFGLQQHPAIQKNGAMLGPGVYLSSKYDVAYFFATQNGSAKRLQPEIWRSMPCFWRLVASPSKAVMNDLRQMAQDRSVDLMCHVVVECTIVQPQAANGNANNTTKEGSKQEGTYYVVSDLHEIHIDKMHLTFEFVKRPKFFGPWTVALMVVLVITFLWNLRDSPFADLGSKVSALF
jgi:hypothetical protein